MRTGLFLKCWLVHGTVFTIRMKQTFRPQCANLLKQNAKIYAFFESKMRNCVKRFFHFVLNPFHYSVYLENINVDDFNNIYNLTIWSLAHQAMNVITTWPFEHKFFALFLSGKPNTLNSIKGVRKCFFCSGGTGFPCRLELI